MNDAAPQNGRARRARIGRAAAGAALLLAGIFAAWQAHQYIYYSGRAAAPPPGPGGTWRYREDAPPRPGSAQDLLGLTQRWTGTAAISGDPDGIAPPPDARRRYGFRRTLTDPDAVVDLVSYDFSGPIAEAVEHYRRTLTERGFVEPGRPRVQGAEVLVFHRDRTDVRVLLRKYGSGNNIVSITIAVTRPGT